jgi:hypothetical protein
MARAGYPRSGWSLCGATAPPPAAASAVRSLGPVHQSPLTLPARAPPMRGRRPGAEAPRGRPPASRVPGASHRHRPHHATVSEALGRPAGASVPGRSRGPRSLHAVWSPDHKRVAFERKRNGLSDIFLVNADGTNKHWVDEGDRLAPGVVARRRQARLHQLPDGQGADLHDGPGRREPAQDHQPGVRGGGPELVSLALGRSDEPPPRGATPRRRCVARLPTFDAAFRQLARSSNRPSVIPAAWIPGVGTAPGWRPVVSEQAGSGGDRVAHHDHREREQQFSRHGESFRVEAGCNRHDSAANLGRHPDRVKSGVAAGLRMKPDGIRPGSETEGRRRPHV